ncbi:MAG: DUF952 domain-containing protein [Rhizobiales bacterium]|nr:DUF952 domain-containing protein [Hyphomicrobiales bacterium]
MELIYKICPASDWEDARKTGEFRGSAVDFRDGFIHLSAPHQVRETARRHFAGQEDLVLVAFEAEDFGASLKWEASRGGDLFPHVYGVLPVDKARWVVQLPLDARGHVFPEEVPQ